MTDVDPHPGTATLPPQRPFRDLPSLLAEHARQRPEHTAVQVGDMSISYAALDAHIDRIAASLQRDGVGPGAAVALCALPSIDYLAVFVAALRVGAAAAPLAPGSTPQQLADMAADAGAALVFTDAGLAEAAVPWPADAHVVQLDGAAANAATARPLAQWLLPAGARPAAVHIDPAWPFNIIYSSGTTGTPKGIVQPHAMRWAHIQRAALSGYTPDAVTLLATPLYSNTTLVSAVPALAGGGTLVLMPKFDAATYLQLAQRHRATHTMLVPVQYQRLLAHPDFDAADLSSFKAKFSTSAPFSAALKAQVLQRWPGGLTEYYGLTEGGGTCVLHAHLFPHKLHTVGQPAEGHDIRLIDDDGREVPRTPGGASAASGEIVGRSPAMMTGYHRQPAKTAEAEWHDAQGRRFLRTGDIGRFDDDGFLVLQDRRKDMVISGGFNIYPSDLEAVLRQHPDVAEAAVVGVPSAAWGETPVAFLALRPGSTTTADDVRNWFNGRVGKTQRLAAAQAVDELPRSAIGKVLKRELRAGWLASMP